MLPKSPPVFPDGLLPKSPEEALVLVLLLPPDPNRPEELLFKFRPAPNEVFWLPDKLFGLAPKGLTLVLFALPPNIPPLPPPPNPEALLVEPNAVLALLLVPKGLLDLFAPPNGELLVFPNADVLLFDAPNAFEPVFELNNELLLFPKGDVLVLELFDPNNPPPVLDDPKADDDDPNPLGLLAPNALDPPPKALPPEPKAEPVLALVPLKGKLFCAPPKADVLFELDPNAEPVLPEPKGDVLLAPNAEEVLLLFAPKGDELVAPNAEVLLLLFVFVLPPKLKPPLGAPLGAPNAPPDEVGGLPFPNFLFCS